MFRLLLKIWHWPAFKRLILFISSLFPDKLYLKIICKGKLGYTPDLNRPQSFNEKLNWIKLYNQNPLYTKMADKYEVKKIVADLIGGQYVVKNLGCWNKFEDIDWDALPDQFVLKCTHDSSGAVICRNKSSFNIVSARKKVNESLQLNYYYACREWPYKNIPPRIIADELLDDHSGKELNDYKFWCFNGVPKYMYCTVKTKREGIYENFYDMNFNPINIDHGWPRRNPEFEKPAAFEEMKMLSEKLSKGIPFVRVDFFYVNGNVYFGEYTFFDWAGLQPFGTIEQDFELGKLIDLSKSM